MGKVINTDNPCCTCKRQEGIDGAAWIYCDIYQHIMLEVELFDETGELHGCHLHVEPVIDWCRVKVDTPVEITQGDEVWVAHFAHLNPSDNPMFWSKGTTSHTAPTKAREIVHGHPEPKYKLIDTEEK